MRAKALRLEVSHHEGPLARDGHDTDTKYRYCRYLRVRGKYRYFHQVSLIFDAEPALFMVSMYVRRKSQVQENVNQSEEKAEKCNFFLELCLMELDQDKIINCVPDRILHSCPKSFWQRCCVTVKLC